MELRKPLFACAATLVKYSLILILFGALSIRNVSATSEPQFPEDFDIETTPISWIPGEQYDLFKGTLDYSTIDLNFPGNGLPIQIRRSFRQPNYRSSADASNDYPTFDIGHMYLDIPTLKVSVLSGKGKYCSQIRMNNHETINDDNENSILNITGPITFVNGPVVVSFYETERTKYVSQDNWTLTCTSSAFIVESPSGEIYEMAIRKYGNSSLGGTYKVTKVEDAYGNWLKYNYKTSNNTTSKILESIESQDERRVTLNWIKNSDGYYTRLLGAFSNGAISRKVAYDFNRHSKSLTVKKDDTFVSEFEFTLGKLSKITLPTGGSVTYSYGDLSSYNSFSTRGNARYFPLKSRQMSDGGLYQFEYNELTSSTFNRIVKSPKTTVEYRFKKSTLPKRGIVRSETSESAPMDGKLITERNFGVPNLAWSQNSVPIMEKHYAYKKLKTVSNYYAAQDSDLIVPNSVITFLNPLSGGQFKTSFRTLYKEHDDFGNPLKLVEFSSDNSSGVALSREIKLTYKNQLTPHRMIGFLETRSIANKTNESYMYNDKGSVISETVDGITTNWSYYESGDSRGELQSENMGGRGTTIYADYYRGIAKRITDPMGRVKLVEVSNDGTVAAETQFGSSSQSFYSYDQARRLSSSISARNSSSQVDYRWESPVHKVTSSGQYINNTLYDEFGREIVSSDYSMSQNKRQTIRFEYDTNGRLVHQSYPTSLGAQGAKTQGRTNGITYTYDGFDRVTSIVIKGHDHDAKTTYRYGYASSGNLTIETKNLKGATTLTEYRGYAIPSYAAPVRIVDAHGVSTSVVRDELLRILRIERAGMIRLFSYGENGQLMSKNQPENGVTEYEYYEDGLLKKSTTGSQVVDFRYHADGKISLEKYSADGNWLQRRYLYDNYGRLNFLETLQDNGAFNSLAYQHDEENNLVQESLEIDGKFYKIEYVYDQLSNLTRIVYPNGRAYDLNPNAFGQPTRFVEEGGGKELYTWINHNANGSLNILSRTGFRVVNTVGNGNRLRQVRMERFSENVSESIAGKVYQYDNVGNIVQVLDPANAGNIRYEYDNKKRLINAIGTGSNRWSFNYDTKDNITKIYNNSASSILTYDEKNRLNKLQNNGRSRNFSYDSRGNTIEYSKFQANNEVKGIKLKFNAADQLVSYNNSVAYAYDGNGLRVKNTKISGGSIYSFYARSGNLMFRDDNGAGVTSEYFYVDGKLIARRDTDTSEEIVAKLPGLPMAKMPSSGESVSAVPTFTWTPAENATGYYLDVSKVPSDSALIYQYYSSEDANCHSGQKTCSVVRASVQLSGNHKWKVRSVNAAGMSAWSQGLVFKAGGGVSSDIPKAPILIAPSGTIDSSKPLFEWAPSSQAVEYKIEIEKVNDTGDTVLHTKTYRAADLGCSDLLNSCLIGVNELSFTGNNRWRVRSANANDEGAWSVYMSFKIQSDGSETTLNGLTVTLPNDGWYQVQDKRGNGIGCDGVEKCTLPEAGNYIVINHDTGERKTISTVEPLSLNVPSTAKYGWGYGTKMHKKKIVYSFNYSGSDELKLSANTFDVDVSDELSISLNGKFVSHSVKGENNQLVPMQEFKLPSAELKQGENVITFSVKSSGWKWGVTNVEVSNHNGGSSTTATISVEGRTIKLPSNDRYQVQSESGGNIGCNGVTSCTVSSPGKYIVINHDTGYRVTIDVKDASTSYPNGIIVSGRTINWSNPGWHQVQTADGSSSICGGGTSCTVSSQGSYIVIDHDAGTRTTVAVQ